MAHVQSRRDSDAAREVLQALALSPEALSAVGPDALRWLEECMAAFPLAYDPVKEVAVSWERLELYLACVRFTRNEAERGRPYARSLMNLMHELEKLGRIPNPLGRIAYELERHALTQNWPVTAAAAAVSGTTEVKG